VVYPSFMPVISEPEFNEFCKPMVGLPVATLWQGYGSAIFLEFGMVQPRRRRDGSPRNPRGEWTLMIEWSWRIEGKRRIWCGSWSEGERWPRAFKRLAGASVDSVGLVGRISEIDIGLSNGLHVVSMMTREGDPEWGLIRRAESGSTSVGVSAGRLVMAERLANETS
jgi:hypothetical protein